MKRFNRDFDLFCIQGSSPLTLLFIKIDVLYDNLEFYSENEHHATAIKFE